MSTIADLYDFIFIIPMRKRTLLVDKTVLICYLFYNR